MLIFLLARRYLLSKSLPAAINIIITISIVGIALGTAALIFVLSVFNGFHTLVRDMFEDFDADLRITPRKGKYFVPTPELIQKIRSTPGINAIVPILEGKAILKNKDKQHVIELKGVGREFEKVSEIKRLLQAGEFILQKTPPTIVMGTGVAYFVNATPSLWENPMQLFTVPEKKNLSPIAEETIRQLEVYPAGIFSMQKEYDEQIVLINIENARQLFEVQDAISAFELAVSSPHRAEKVKKILEQKLGSSFAILTWYEQHQTLYELMKNEKKIGFGVITLILLLIASNIVSSLTIIVLEKRKDIGILRSMGATPGKIAQIFLALGLYVGIYGGSSGLALGIFLTFLQAQFGIFRIKGGESFIIDYFPVELQALDIFLVGLTVISLCILSSIYPCIHAAKQPITQSLAK
ncbi:MAG: FtsX-like permease family protein [Bacteroidia bacterium]|nr:ABC transporter permease [Bacteroidia bacterium]MDW8158490.1 FtsX-like permease family protein [Bacteroidia bacterium]